MAYVRVGSWLRDYTFTTPLRVASALDELTLYPTLNVSENPHYVVLA